MLLRHDWLAPLILPPTITEEDEEDVEGTPTDGVAAPVTINEEVAQWVTDAMERKRIGTMGKRAKPALHAAPLNAVPSPSLETTSA